MAATLALVPQSARQSVLHRPVATRAPVTRVSRRHRTAAVYRRRRFVAVALGLGLVVVAGQASAALGGSSLAPVERRPQAEAVVPESVVPESFVVEPGDTLWSIAERLDPDADPRDVVDALVRARGTASLLPGETITWVAD